MRVWRSYNYLCANEQLAQVLTAQQCAFRFFSFNAVWCGVAIEQHGSDYSTLAVDYLGLFQFPRQITTDQYCYDPFDCIDLCARLRDAGMAPATCSFCQPACPVNVLETLDEMVLGVYHDVFMALKITIECLEGGIENCVCAVALMLRPEWLSPNDYRYSPEQKCYTGDPLKQIIGQIGHMLLGDVGNFFKGFASIFHLPFSGPSAIDVLDKQVREECETPDRFGHGDADKCYYARIDEICTSDVLYKQFLAINGRDHELHAATPQQELQSLRPIVHGVADFSRPIGLCRDAVQVRLDMLIEGCIFKMLTGNPLVKGSNGICHGRQSERVLYILKNATWDLPKVRFLWNV